MHDPSLALADTFDTANRLSDLVTAAAGGAILAAYHYQYAGDHSQNRTDEWDNGLAAGDPSAFSTGRHVHYTYDNLGIWGQAPFSGRVSPRAISAAGVKSVWSRRSVDAWRALMVAAGPA